MLDEAGYPNAVISASSDLDENLITSLKLQGATITLWGVGTKLITSDDCPAFGGVYKLAAEETENGDFEPKIKLSNNVEKVTNPGIKKIIRIYDKKTGKIKADLLALEEEEFTEDSDLYIYDTNAKWKSMQQADRQAGETSVFFFSCASKDKFQECQLPDIKSKWLHISIPLVSQQMIYVS